MILKTARPVEILLVEDSAGDARLVREAFNEGKLMVNLSVVADGVEAMAYLRHEGNYAHASIPELILLDLNLPRKDGREVLAEIKQDPKLKSIPVIIMTTSDADKDVAKCYNDHANCFITKPLELEAFFKVVKGIEGFWFTIVKLPPD